MPKNGMFYNFVKNEKRFEQFSYNFVKNRNRIELMLGCSCRFDMPTSLLRRINRRIHAGQLRFFLNYRWQDVTFGKKICD